MRRQKIKKELHFTMVVFQCFTFRQKGHFNPNLITKKTPTQKMKNKSMTMTSIM